MDLIQIGKFIAELRKAQGLTQEQFGEKVGVTNRQDRIYAAVLMLALAHGWRNNKMMTYVENNAYDGSKA